MEIGIRVDRFALTESFAHFVNDGLMAIFFLLVGLEIKRELLTGELSGWRIALLPMLAAAGGVIVPAIIFVTINYGDAVALRGWAVPVATDIAFSLGVLALLGSRVPLALKVFLTAVAVIDDLFAILIIALFYSDDIKVGLLGYGLVALCAMMVLNAAGVRRRSPYLLLGAVLWLCLLKSGVHATIGGVLTALCIPHRTKRAKDVDTPLVQLEHDLHTPVTYMILPLFAFVNAGLSLSGVSADVIFSEKLAAGITFGLFIGKPVGIFLTCLLAVKSGLCRLPTQSTWSMMLAVAFLCGIGFTVSLFIGNLAYLGVEQASMLNLMKIGVFAGSILSGIAGYVLLRAMLSTPEKATGAT